mmetsp:Transcript_32668/g.100412  ORF Transcript_32668/g.100412 Transcript_32668/m.100412 type:complete len:275 (+) Transcript_32668:585-1409(+)
MQPGRAGRRPRRAVRPGEPVANGPHPRRLHLPGARQPGAPGTAGARGRAPGGRGQLPALLRPGADLRGAEHRRGPAQGVPHPRAGRHGPGCAAPHEPGDGALFRPGPRPLRLAFGPARLASVLAGGAAYHGPRGAEQGQRRARGHQAHRGVGLHLQEARGHGQGPAGAALRDHELLHLQGHRHRQALGPARHARALERRRPRLRAALLRPGPCCPTAASGARLFGHGPLRAPAAAGGALGRLCSCTCTPPPGLPVATCLRTRTGHIAPARAQSI